MSNNNKEYFEPLIGIDECVHVSPIKIGSKVRPPAIADPAKRTAPPPMIPKLLTTKRTGKKFDGKDLPPGQSDLQVEKARS